MKIRKEYFIKYDEDDILIMKHGPGGKDEVICPISMTAAMAWDGFDRGMSRESLIEAIVGEFDGASEEIVSIELDALASRLIELGYAEE